MQCELCKSSLRCEFKCRDEVINLVDISRPKGVSYVILEAKRKLVVLN